jgi:DnaJ-class molecular chaperone
MNYYEILGVTEWSTVADVKRAYRKLAQQHHPDKTHDNGEKFKLIKEAYDAIRARGPSKRPKQEAKPESKPEPTSNYTWQDFAQPKAQYSTLVVPVDFSDLFGTTIRIKGTPYQIRVPYGVQDGEKQNNVRVETPGGQHYEYYNIVYQVRDSTGFYFTKMIDGVNTLCCKINLTSGMVLAEYEISLRNINPNLENFTIKASNRNFQRVQHVGLPGSRVSRGDLIVEQNVELKSLDNEIYPVLVALNDKVKEVLQGKTYSQHIK